MKKLYVILFAASLFVASCTKSNSSNTTVLPMPVAAYSVSGIQDIVMSSSNYYTSVAVSAPITFTYNDSSEQKLSVAISGFPGFIKYGTSYSTPTVFHEYFTGPWSGIPTFTIPLQLYFNDALTYVAGTYPIVVTCTNESGSVKTFNMNLICK